MNFLQVAILHCYDANLTASFAAGPFPFGLAFDGCHIWVANNSGNNVGKLRASDGADLGTSPVGAFPEGVAFDGARIWVTNFGSNNVTRLRASDGAAQGTFATGAGPEGVVFDGVNIWIADGSSNTVTKLRAAPATASISVRLLPAPFHSAWRSMEPMSGSRTRTLTM